MHIAMDYDNTYTADPKCMRAVIRCFQSNGHKVSIVTMREETKDWDDEFSVLKDKYEVDTIFCDGNPKRKVCEDQNIFIDVWLDDYPEGIHLGSQYTPEELNQWRIDQGLKSE